MDKRAKVLVIVLLTMVLAVPGFAEEGHGDGHHGFDWWAFLGKTFNAVVLFGGLIVFLRKPLIKLLAQKSLDVKNDIQQREEEIIKTTSQVEDLQKRLDKIETEVNAMKTAAGKSGGEEKQRLEELAKSESQRIKELTEAEIDTRIDNAVRSLKSRVADLTIDHFKKDIEKHLDKKAHEKIIEKNIDICGDIIERE